MFSAVLAFQGKLSKRESKILAQEHESPWSHLCLSAQDCQIFLEQSFLFQSAPVCSSWTGDFVCHHPLNQGQQIASSTAFYLDTQPTQPLLPSWHLQRNRSANRCRSKIPGGSPGARFIRLLGMGAIAQLLWCFLGSLDQAVSWAPLWRKTSHSFRSHWASPSSKSPFHSAVKLLRHCNPTCKESLHSFRFIANT